MIIGTAYFMCYITGIFFEIIVGVFTVLKIGQIILRKNKERKNDLSNSLINEDIAKI